MASPEPITAGKQDPRMIPDLLLLGRILLVAAAIVALLAVGGIVAFLVYVRFALEPDPEEFPVPPELAAWMRAVEGDVAGTMAEIGRRLAPVIELTARQLRTFYAAWPGMPYTAPSLWDAEQMAADVRPERRA